MASSPPRPPLNVSGYSWRALRPDDRQEIVSLQHACAGAHGDLLDRTSDSADSVDAPLVPQTSDAICAVTEVGHIAAVGWVRIDTLSDGYRAYLVGAVHPYDRNRGIGRAMLAWSEFRARQLLMMLPQDRSAVIRIDCLDVRPDAEQLYTRLGFSRWFRAYEMQRDLSPPIVDCSLPEGMRLVTWSAAHAQTFHAVHEDAWSSRVGRNAARSDHLDRGVDGRQRVFARCVPPRAGWRRGRSIDPLSHRTEYRNGLDQQSWCSPFLSGARYRLRIGCTRLALLPRNGPGSGKIGSRGG